MFSSKIPKNIPVSLSLLHDQEYHNVCRLMNMTFKKNEKRRANTEKHLSSPKHVPAFAKKIQLPIYDF